VIRALKVIGNITMQQSTMSCNFRFVFHINYASVLYCFRASYLSKVAKNFLPTCIWRLRWGRFHWNFIKVF